MISTALHTHSSLLVAQRRTHFRWVASRSTLTCCFWTQLCFAHALVTWVSITLALCHRARHRFAHSFTTPCRWTQRHVAHTRHTLSLGSALLCTLTHHTLLLGRIALCTDTLSLGLASHCTLTLTRYTLSLGRFAFYTDWPQHRFAHSLITSCRWAQRLTPTHHTLFVAFYANTLSLGSAPLYTLTHHTLLLGSAPLYTLTRHTLLLGSAQP